MKTFFRILIIILFMLPNNVFSQSKEKEKEINNSYMREKEKYELSSEKSSGNKTYQTDGILFQKRIGDYVLEAGNNYLLGTGLEIGGGVLVALSDNNEELIYVGAGLALSGLVCTIIGHIKLIKAGKKLNKNKQLNENKKISFQPSSSGIGLAMKF